MTRDRRPAVERVRPPAVLLRIANPVVRRVLTSPFHALLDRHLAVLRYTGRRSGRRVAIPVARHEIDGSSAVISSSPWRMNFRGGQDAEMLVNGRWAHTHGTLVSDVEQVADYYDRRVAALGWRKAARELGLRVNVERAPTREELVEAIRRSGLSIVVFEPSQPRPDPS